LGFGPNDGVGPILLFRGGEIEPVVVEEVHSFDVLAVDNGNGVGAAQSNEKRDWARLDDLKPEKLLIEAARESEVVAFQRAVRQKVELERWRRFFALHRCGCVHESLTPVRGFSKSALVSSIARDA